MKSTSDTIWTFYWKSLQRIETSCDAAG